MQIITYYYMLSRTKFTELLFTELPKNKTQRKISPSNPSRLFFFLSFFLNAIGPCQSSAHPKQLEYHTIESSNAGLIPLQLHVADKLILAPRMHYAFAREELLYILY